MYSLCSSCPSLVLFCLMPQGHFWNRDTEFLKPNQRDMSWKLGAGTIHRDRWGDFADGVALRRPKATCADQVKNNGTSGSFTYNTGLVGCIFHMKRSA